MSWHKVNPKNLVGQLVQSLLNDHPDQTICYKLEIGPRGVLVPDDCLKLFDLVGAGEHLESLLGRFYSKIGYC